MILWGMLLVFLLLPIIPILLRFRGVTTVWLDAASWVGYLSFGFLTLLFAILIARDLIVLVTLGFAKIVYLAHYIFGSGESASHTIDPERRRLLINSVNIGLLGFTGALTGYGIYEALRDPDVVNIDVPIKNLPEEFDGFRVVQITDIHVSSTLKRGFVQRVVNIVNGLAPDLLVLTGDLVDGTVGQLGYDVAPLTELRAPHGKFFTTGNHEYYSGVQQWVEEMPKLGFTVLLNEHRIVERGVGRLLLAGVTDFEGGRFAPAHVTDPFKALAGAPDGIPRILLAHQPKSIFKASEAGYDYVISGHTHGGQYFPYHFLAALTQPYIRGFHTYNGTQIYVSKGTGYWGPQLRIGAKSEITVHRLVRA